MSNNAPTKKDMINRIHEFRRDLAQITETVHAHSDRKNDYTEQLMDLEAAIDRLLDRINAQE